MYNLYTCLPPRQSRARSGPRWPNWAGPKSPFLKLNMILEDNNIEYHFKILGLKLSFWTMRRVWVHHYSPCRGLSNAKQIIAFFYLNFVKLPLGSLILIFQIKCQIKISNSLILHLKNKKSKKIDFWRLSKIIKVSDFSQLLVDKKFLVELFNILWLNS